MIAEASEHDEQVAIAEELMQKKDYDGVIQKTKNVLEELEPHLPTISQAAILQGRAIMTKTMNKRRKTGHPPSKDDLEKVWQSYELSQMLDPECEESDRQLSKVSKILRKLTPKKDIKADYDVLIVGAGAAGIGTSLMLTETFGLDNSRVVMMERGEKVGDSFRKWPEEMRFISPSFNQQGWTQSFDLNSISSGTSPAFSLHTQHPSGKEYAVYLESITKLRKLNVQTLTEVVSIQDISVEVEGKEEEKLPLFSVNIRSLNKIGTRTDKESKGEEKIVTARHIVWAAGEFQYPKGIPKNHPEKDDSTNINQEDKNSDEFVDIERNNFVGEELCRHNSTVKSWAKLPGEEYVIIGGYESGVDAAVNLSRAGKKCKVFASTPCWNVKTADPSAELAPYTASRLREVLAPTFSPQPQLFAPLRVTSVEKKEDGGYRVTAEWKALEEASETPNLRNIVNRNVKEELQGEEGSTVVINTPNPPILCTGFEGSVSAAASHLFDFAENEADGENDEADFQEEGNSESDEVEEKEGDEHMDDLSESTEDESKEENAKLNDEEPGQNAQGGCLEGAPLLTDEDESTKVPGVFLVGPTVSHGTLSFCFVYKFRQRFAVVAKAICEGLGIDTRAAVNECRKMNMFLDDFSCCGDTCGDVC